jgi:hypothetical protein
MATRSLIETVACHHIIRRRNYVEDEGLLQKVYGDSQILARKLQAFRKSLSNPRNQIREETSEYGDEDLI